jgi:AcrR family transcriptional regulator
MEQNKDEIIKAAILESAAVLFQKWGLNKTTMEDIAKAAGKGKSTLYYYYPSKEEIFYIVMSNITESIINISEEIISKEIKAEDKLKKYFLTFISEMKKFANLYEIVRGEIKDHPHLINRIRTKYDTEESKRIGEIINYGIKTREFKKFNQKDTDVIAYTVVSTMRSLLIDLYIENKFYNDEERVNFLLDLIINGLKK